MIRSQCVTKGGATEPRAFESGASSSLHRAPLSASIRIPANRGRCEVLARYARGGR